MRQSRTLVVFGVLALIVFASLRWLVHPYYEATVETNDASMYILSAQSLAAGQGYAYLEQPFTVRPPGMSALLVPILAWRGLDFGAMHLLVSVFGAIGVLCLFAWMQPRVGNAVAAALAIFVWLNPGYRHFCNQVMSDVPGMTLTLALLLIERRAEKGRSWKNDLLLGVCIAVASYVRTILLVLLPAIVLARLAGRLSERDRPKTWFAFLAQQVLPLSLATLVVLLPWSLRNSAVKPTGPVDQNFIHSYATGMLRVDGGDPGSAPRPFSDITQAIPDRAQKLLSLLGSRMETSEGRAGHLVLGWIVVLAAGILLWRQRRSAEAYFFLVVFVLLVYFGFRARLVLPLFVLGWAALSEVLHSLGARFLPPAVARSVIAAALLVFVLCDIPFRDGRERLEQEHRANLEQARDWREGLAPDARLAAPIGWHDSVYLGQPVYSFFFAVQRKAREATSEGRKLTPRNDMQGAEDVIDKYGLNTVILGRTSADLSVLPYFQNRYGPGQRAGEGWIFRVRP